MIKFLKSISLAITLIFLLSSEIVYSKKHSTFLNITIQKDNLNSEILFKNNKQLVTNQTIDEIKKSQILLLIIITFFVFGFLFLIYHLKKVRIINEQLEVYSKENEFLISETNHRVNNNLQLISLLISDTSRKKQSEENKKDFARLQSKVDSIALLHRHLYQSKNTSKINLQNYLNEIKENFNVIDVKNKLFFKFTIDEIEINSDNAMYLGLLVTELIINSVKYAFDDNQEKIINLEIINQCNILKFYYRDNGKKAIGQDINPKLVTQLCIQLGVNYEINTNSGFHLSFTKNPI